MGGHRRPGWRPWEAEVGGRGRPKWEAEVGGRSGRPWEAEVGGPSERPKHETKVRDQCERPK